MKKRIVITLLLLCALVSGSGCTLLGGAAEQAVTRVLTGSGRDTVVVVIVLDTVNVKVIEK